MTLDELNRMDHKMAIQQLFLCCGSHKWAELMAKARPFESEEALHHEAEKIWNDLLDESDWREAFLHHPKIGNINSLREKYSDTRAWAENEQKGAMAASESVLQKLADRNRMYEERFGYIFIVCATGKSADEMLGILDRRLGHSPKEEFLIAGGEQQKITKIRLEKMLS